MEPDKERAIELLAEADRRLEAGDLKAAERLYEGAISLSDNPHLVLLDSLALIYRERGDLDRAKRRLEEIVGICEEEACGSPSHGKTLSNLGSVYLELGEPELALDCHRRAIQILEGTPALLAQAQNAMGAVYLEQKDLNRALTLHEDALRTFRQTRPQSSDVARALLNVGVIQAARGESQPALTRFEEARRLLEAGAPRSPDLARAHTRIAELHQEVGRLDSALEHYERAVAIFDEVAPRCAGMVSALTGLGVACRARGDLHAAIGHLSRAVEVAESLRARAGAPEHRERLFARHQSPYQILIGCLYERGADGDAEKGFGLAERSRARALVELLAEVEHLAGMGSRLRGETPEQQGLLQKERDLQVELAATYRRLVEARQPDLADRSAVAGLAAEERKLSGELLKIRSDIRDSFPAYAELRYPQSLTAREVQDRLDPETLLLAYDATGDETFVWALRHDAFGMFELDAGGERLADLVDEAIGGYRADSGSPGSPAGVRAKLADALLKPVPKHFWEGTRFVIVVPDGHLHYLPLELLPAPGGADGELLLDRFPVAYAPSATTLDWLSRRSSEAAPQFEFVGFGHRPSVNAIPATRREVEEITRTFERHGAEYRGPYIDADATKRAARSESEDVRFVHFATHGVFNDERPQYSGLQLAPPRPEDPVAGTPDGFLRVYEMFDMRLSAEAVICSSCETGLGAIHDGEGMVGMSRALFFAGAQCVVVSLWPVRDEPTRKLMERFYIEVLRGQPLAEALRTAKREVRKGYDDDPCHWAAFVAVGLAWNPGATADGGGPPMHQSREEIRGVLEDIREWELDDASWAQATVALEGLTTALGDVDRALSRLGPLSPARLSRVRFGQPTGPPPKHVLEQLNTLVHKLG